MRTQVVLVIPVLMALLACRCFSTNLAPAMRMRSMPTLEETKDEVSARVLTVGPDNTAVVAGQRATFTCISNNSDTLTWFQTDLETHQDSIIVFYCALNPDAGDNFALESVGPGRCDLVVKSVSVRDATVHRCLQMSATEIEPQRSAMMAVLDAEPECRIDNVNPRINDNVTLTCDVSYTDNISPMMMTWTDEQGNTVPSSSGTNRAGHTTSSLTFTVTSFTMSQYTCTTAFSDPVGLPVTATNTPAYSYSWTSPQLVVKGELVKPLNTAEQAGSSVTLPCRLRTPDVAWSFVPFNSTYPINVVYNPCKVAPNVEHLYRVDTEGEGCHLVIDALSFAHAGVYTCNSFTPNETPASAQLIVLEKVNCTSDVVNSLNQVQLTCSVAYSGNFAPVMTWTDETGAVLPSTSDSTRTRVESRVTVIPVDTSNVISALTHFDAPSVELPGHVDPATNAPNYTHSWTIRLPIPDEQGTTEEIVSTSTTTTTTTTTTPTTTTTTAPGTCTPSAISDLEDCGAIKKSYPSAQSGKYCILIRAKQLRMEVYCDMDTTGGGWTVFQRRQDGSVNFYRNWASYVAGFGERDGEFWLGNDNLAALTGQKQYVLRFDLGDWANNRRYAQYTNFKVREAKDKYQIATLGTYSGNAGDSMQDSNGNYNHLGRFFSTYDQDNDSWVAGNCAATESRGAWWYCACHKSNLNGEYNNTQTYKGLNWYSWMGWSYSLKFTEMKIRPFDF